MASPTTVRPESLHAGPIAFWTVRYGRAGIVVFGAVLAVAPGIVGGAEHVGIGDGQAVTWKQVGTPSERVAVT